MSAFIYFNHFQLFKNLCTKSAIVLITHHSYLPEVFSSSFVVRSKNLYICTPREVAQVVAHLVWDQRVAGSNPVFPTLKGAFWAPFFV
jgi:hypothetical protein